MSAPIIDSTQSIIDPLQWQNFGFQPYASNAPTGWSSSPLPPGVSIDGATGLISGAPSLYGTYVVAVRATNADGTSPPVLFTIGVEASSPTAGSDVDLEVDIISGEVRLGGPVALAGVSADAAALPLFSRKYLDDLFLRVVLKKAGVVVDPNMSSVVATLKELDTEIVLKSSDGWARSGTGGAATFRVHMLLDGAPLQGALSNYADPERTFFPAHMEISWVATNPDSGTLGSATFRGSSNRFLMAIAKNQAP